MKRPEERLLRKGERPDLEAFTSFIQEMDKESPRGVVLISCATIHDLLGRLIELFLVSHKAVEALLDGQFAPLGTFSARILAAVSLGLINDAEYRDCEMLRKIRNIFAHDVKVSFREQRIKDLCRNLRFFGDTYMNRKIDTEGVFRLSAVAIMQELVNRMYTVAQRQLQTQSWFPEQQRVEDKTV
jgi:DNA-binding MltR family transcriptional regulator